MTQTNKKYELLDSDTVTTPSGRVLKRIRALVAIGTVVASGELGGYIETEQNLDVNGDAWVSGDARVYGDALVSGNARVSGDAWVDKRRDIFWLSIIGSENGTYTAFKNKDGGVSVSRGCFNGTFKQFIDAVEATHISTEFYHEYQAVIELTKARLSVEAEA